MEEVVGAKFEFEVGDVVQVIIAPDVKLKILERSYRECSGGSQVFYSCGMSFMSEYTSKRVTGKHNQIFNEIELEKWKEEVEEDKQVI